MPKLKHCVGCVRPQLNATVDTPPIRMTRPIAILSQLPRVVVSNLAPVFTIVRRACNGLPDCIAPDLCAGLPAIGRRDLASASPVHFHSRSVGARGNDPR
jgi:hypothetical protein